MNGIIVFNSFLFSLHAVLINRKPIMRKIFKKYFYLTVNDRYLLSKIKSLKERVLICNQI